MLVDVEADAFNATATVDSFGPGGHILTIYGGTMKNQLHVKLRSSGQTLDKNQGPKDVEIGYYLDAMGRNAWVGLEGDDASAVSSSNNLDSTTKPARPLVVSKPTCV